tara:strand:+ start:117 stop:905 length:789 start_codon:yes stop_codon:yes gene_type:complete
LSVDDLEVAIRASIRASEIILENYGTYKQLDFKSDIDVVTEVDYKCEEAITKILREETPEYGIMAEEGTNFPGEKVWVVDPLDGTINFSHSFPVFGPSIGLCRGDDVLLGVVTDPLRDELFYAERGSGAFVNDLHNKGTPRRIHVSKVNNLKQAIINCGLPFKREDEYYQKMGKKLVELHRDIQSVRYLGVAAITLAYIAAGRLEGYIVSGPHPWDMAGGIAILEEAGGKITDFQGESYTLDNFEWMATNGHLHDTLVDRYK